MEKAVREAMLEQYRLLKQIIDDCKTVDECVFCADKALDSLRSIHYFLSGRSKEWAEALKDGHLYFVS